VAMYGDLGSGKTEFVRGICEYFNVGEIVSSPTFTIMNHYSGNSPDDEDDEVKIYHLDLYRINSKRELEDIGFNECTMSNDCIKLIEWADKANGSLPKKRYSVIFRFEDSDDEARIIEIRHVHETDVEDVIVVELQH
jgi:tRNA threonylcarbamoyladenosine biosynthesis protein TsaE